ncbi:MAG: hypothetical protein EOR73_15250 [Mesorhizobium sp.]|nr:MAG: hypothetical protein EOR73_15250 [Mesorhizobium sp.]
MNSSETNRRAINQPLLKKVQSCVVLFPLIRQRVALEELARGHAADPNAHRRFAVALCATDAVITNVDFSRTK